MRHEISHKFNFANGSFAICMRFSRKQILVMTEKAFFVFSIWGIRQSRFIGITILSCFFFIEQHVLFRPALFTYDVVQTTLFIRSEIFTRNKSEKDVGE